MNDHLLASFDQCENALDMEFNVEEIQHAIKRLKQGRASGPDGVSPEHLRFSGPVFQNWLCQIYNNICQHEEIPKCFKHGIIIPVFKGKERDPLLKENYRGITLTSVLAKVLEITLMQRITPILDDADIQQNSQTAYRKGVSCQDSIFAGIEANSRFVIENEKVYTCFYDLASAFDTVEFSILLDELFQAGISGKCWRLVRNWYGNLVSQVKLGTHLSKSFNISRGIRQGSVLSPTLFNLVIDPLLSTLKKRNLGVSINGLYLGAFTHADDIRTSATNLEDVSEQVSTVDNLEV